MSRGGFAPPERGGLRPHPLTSGALDYGSSGALSEHVVARLFKAVESWASAKGEK